MNRQPSSGVDVALGLLLSVAAVAGVLWAGGASSAWASGHRLPHGEPLAGLIALGHVGDPSAAWHSPVGPAAIYWTCTLVALAVAGLVACAGWRLWHLDAGAKRAASPVRAEGLAARSEVRRAAGARALVARSKALRPSLHRPRPDDLGYRVGTSRRVGCWASVEDSMLLLGPPRSGKGQSVVIPMILDAPGAVVTTSTRADNLAVTLAARTAVGPVAVFDPQGLAHCPSRLPALRWSLVRGCENPQTAMIRAEALVSDAGRSGVENGTFWRQQALAATRCMLHAAALDGRSPADLQRWSHAAPGAKEAVSILTSHPIATPGWERALDAIIASDQRTRDSIWAMVANTFAPLADPAVLAAVSPEPGKEFDPVAFLAMRGTLFLLGTASGASATATLVAALMEDVIDAARHLAASSPGQRLDPPVALVLDEAANYPLPSLPSLVSEGGGSGITTLAVLQSLAQARDRWGREAAGTIWDASIVKIVLGGSANAEDLKDLSRLIGDTETTEWTHTVQAGAAGRSVSSSTRLRPILEPSEIRRLPIGHGLLLLRSARPIMMKLQPWTARPDADELAEARRRFELPAVEDS
jgi:type IV secretory pathway TraG/TraD family ATPase VirD4